MLGSTLVVGSTLLAGWVGESGADFLSFSYNARDNISHGPNFGFLNLAASRIDVLLLHGMLAIRVTRV